MNDKSDYQFRSFASCLLMIFVGVVCWLPASHVRAQAAQCAKTLITHDAMASIDTKALSQDRASQETAQQLIDFAIRNHMPMKMIEVGPSNRRVKRLMVAVDTTNEVMIEDYLSTFNLHHRLGEVAAGTLAIEAERQYDGVDYVFVTTRTTGKINDPSGTWRFGKAGADPSDWWSERNVYDQPAREADGRLPAVVAYGHLIGVTESERQNLDYYFSHPEERGPCKSSNCVAWMPGIEFGKTSREGDDESRRPLFNLLGIARTVAHFELASRLMHAANDKNIATVAFVRGAEGLKQFRERDDLLPPEPKLPYPSVIPGLGYASDSPIMKAIEQIPDGAKIFIPIAAGASPDGIAALVQNASSLKKGYTLDLLVNGVSESTLRKGIETTDGKFKVRALFLGGNLRALNRDGKIEVIPGYLSDFTRWVRDPGKPDFHYDTILVRVSPPDNEGRYSLGPNNDMILTILRSRPNIKVIAEVNANVPHTVGDNYLVESQITAKFSSRVELANPAFLPPYKPEIAIANYLAELIQSGSHLQVGIGGLFGALGKALHEKGRTGIKIFSEMFGDPQMEMLENGVADSAEAGFAYGSTALYKKLDRNQKVRFVETEYVNNPGRIARLANFNAVNTALQVNLRGDANATHGEDGERISSPGGQVEFMSGAARSEDGTGKAIIAIRSTARREEISTIVLDNYAGSVTTSHENVNYVVTEYGIAALQGVNESVRAARLISIAHPKFREQLIEKALRANLLKKSDLNLVVRK